MNRIFIGVFCTLLCISPNDTQAQSNTPLSRESAEDQVGTLINSADYRRLSEIFPDVRDSLSPSLGTLADALVFYYTGKPAKSNVAIERIVNEYKEELGSGLIFGMLNLSIYNSRTLGDYAESCHTIKTLLNILPASATEAHSSLTAYLRWMTALADWPATSVIRPATEVTIPIDIRKVGRGEHINFDVQMNGMTEPFIFDTGCGYSNFVTTAAAERLGIRILADSIPVTGMTTAYTKVGVADSMQIGPITIYHPTFIIADLLSGKDTKQMSEAVLGTDAILALGEIRFEPALNQMILPVVESKSDTPNLGFDAGQYLLNCHSGQEALSMQFDTGNVRSDLFGNYYDRHRKEIQASGKKATSTHGGFGGVRKLQVYNLPTLTIEGTGHPVTLHQVTVIPRGKKLDAQHDAIDGSLGVDFVTACHAITIDLKRMYVRTE